MPDLVSDGGEFSCNFCTGKLKLSVASSSTTGDSKKIANQSNCFFPPPGGNCTFPPGVPPSPCPGIPPGSVIATGQSTVKVDGQTALGDGAKFLCPKGQPVTLSKAGQTVAKHDEASGGVGAKVVGGCLIVAGVALAIFLLPEEAVAAIGAGAVIGSRAAARAVARVGPVVLKKVATKTKQLGKKIKNSISKGSKAKPSPNEGANNNALHQMYKKDLRRQMEKPHVKDPELQKIMDKVYRPNAKVGSGSTADAIRHEISTGNSVGGKMHTQKGNDTLNELGKWIRKNENNPSVKPGDLDAAKNVFLDTVDALNTVK